MISDEKDKAQEEVTEESRKDENEVRPIETAPAQESGSEDTNQEEQEIPEHIKSHMFDNEINKAEAGDKIDLLQKCPGIHNLYIAAGWDQRAMEEEKIDVDLCCFLLDKDDQTPDNESFIFYNNEGTLNGGVKHLGDSRTGAGDGDDETIFLDLHSLPFEISKVVFTLSVYDDSHKGHTFQMVRNVFLRLINQDDDDEVLRVEMADDFLGENTGVLVAALSREGPDWHFEVINETSDDGLAYFAERYGILIAERTG